MRPWGLDADEVRSSVEAMAAAVRRVAADGHDTWVAPFPDVVEALLEVARVDLCLARLVEGHADAMRILDQAGAPPSEGVYGVWASRSAGTGVAATPDGGRWRLTGESRFSSGIDVVDRALLPGWLQDGTHLLFDLPVADAAGVRPDRSSWHTSAMDASRSFTVAVDVAVGPGSVVGTPGSYLGRRGFPIGGLGVAAVWAGGAQSVLELVVAGLRRFEPTAHQLRRVGVMEQSVWAARLAVVETARRLPGVADGDLVRETSAARTAVVSACDRVAEEAARIVGPGGLSGDRRLARTLADLSLYVRQHHLDLTLEALGRSALAAREVTG